MSEQERATSFGAAVDAYQQGRPEYDREHVAWLLDGVQGRVLDLGAGSGKLTRAIAGLGFEVVAVDPDEQMLAAITDIPTLVGTAEQLPLPAASVAAVTVGQAWHWFEPATAGVEIARVLQPGGRLGLIWNTRDLSHPFVATLAPTMGDSPAEVMMDDEDVYDLPGFTAFERSRIDRVRWMTAAELEAMVVSRSIYLTATPETQARIVADVRDLVATHPHTKGRERFEYPLHSTAYRANVL
ncbi:MAG: SAM-dependent methyltransferase [Actinobacteria bacterium HGW-Actinobacteria-2]|nr:MAG: SAM-dependent methyltransferase [Actinobacteria bacterium HGW-Actinobacteria-2]